MTYDKILAALETRTLAVPNIPYVAFEGTNYDPTTGTPYIRTRFMPIDRRPRSIGLVDGKPYLQRYRGIFQLLLNYPDGEGQGPTNQMANALCDAFDAATNISFETSTDAGIYETYVTILQTERMRGIKDGPWFKTPVNVNWYSYSK